MSDQIITVVRPSGVLMPGQEVIMDAQTLIAEAAGRVCYKSEGKSDGTLEGAKKFVRKLIRTYKHESIGEHITMAAHVVGSRSMSHQLVRHRLAVYSQESQRYCDYGKLGFQIIVPPKVCSPAHAEGTWTRNKGTFGTQWAHESGYFVHAGKEDEDYRLSVWLDQAWAAYDNYLWWISDGGLKKEDAREHLPNCAKTEVITTMNARQWRHVFGHRALNPRAQWQVRDICREILKPAADLAPHCFDDLYRDLLECNFTAH